jgi:hypothetical protein
VNVEQIEAIRLQVLLQIDELVATTGPTITVGGDEIPWAPLVESLQRTLDWCDRKLQELAPFEVRSQGTT